MKKFKDYVAEQLAEAKGASLTQSQKAIRFAANAHRKQTRTSGDAYITHPVEVAKIVKQFKKSHNLEALISAAYLHDTVEDTDTELEDITKMFGGLVASMVKELTSDEQSKEFKASKADYLSAKMSSMSSWALVVKLADRIHNISDLNTAKTKKWASNYKKQTTQIMDELEKNRTLTGTHKKMIKAIRMKLKEFEE
jgi:(p)ppGpp synthase/HD superfamily hydrolase|tara:strand:- start:2469 stop:3056 length:588 start_codon:yes stop_codon:yes gene_type:complete